MLFYSLADLVCAEIDDSGEDKRCALLQVISDVGKHTENDVRNDVCNAEIEFANALINTVKQLSGDRYQIEYDRSLVRGQGYYTGTIFEVKLDEYNFSVAGGGRYDEMIGKFSGQNVPACGFSIGFERIITILKDHPAEGETKKDGVAFLLEGGLSEEEILSVFEKAASLREEGKTVTVLPLKKNAKFQIDRLMEDGYAQIERIYRK